MQRGSSALLDFGLMYAYQLHRRSPTHIIALDQMPIDECALAWNDSDPI